MSTRQLRLNDTDLIRKKIGQVIGQKINIVLHDRTVILGTIVATDQSMVAVLNMRLKKTKIPFNQISEIYYDTKE